MTDSFINPLENPEKANALVADLLKDDKNTEVPEIAPQPHGYVRLPGGLVRGLDASQVTYDAEVRELTGADEEYIDRVRFGRPDKFLEAIVERGTVSIGESKSSKQIVAELLLGDAEMLAIEIRRATYGDEVEFPGVVCPHCSAEIDVTIELDDIPVTRLEDTEDRLLALPLRKGRTAHVRLPKFSDLTSEFSNEKLNDAERRTLLLSRVVLSIDEADGTVTAIAGSPDSARALGVADRRTIIDALGKRKVGPAYNEVKFTHEACGKEIPFPLELGDLFRGL